MKPTYVVLGIEQTKAALRTFSKTAQKMIADAVQKHALSCQSRAKDRTPVATGRLRASLQMQFDRDRTTATVGTNVHYAPHVEFGTRKMKARPYLIPAFEQTKPEFQNELKKIPGAAFQVAKVRTPPK